MVNHYTEIFDSFTYSGQPTTLSTSYRSLLKLVKNKNGCISNYKPCGILDTYGNVLCIDEFLDCPINRLKVDHINKASFYIHLKIINLFLSVILVIIIDYFTLIISMEEMWQLL